MSKTTEKRKLQAHPAPKYHKLTKAYANLQEMSVSEAVSIMIKQFFDAMPEKERSRLVITIQKR